MVSFDNSYFLNGYRIFVSYHVETFGNMPIPTYEHPQTSQSYVSEPETPKITEASCSSEVPTSGTQSQTKKCDRWMTAQTKALVYWWKEYYNELETSKQHSLRAKIRN